MTDRYALTGSPMTEDPAIKEADHIDAPLALARGECVYLAWNKQEGAVNYNVYRSPVPDGDIDYSYPWAVCSGTAWTSIPLDPGRWFFAVFSVDAYGNESPIVKASVTI